MTPSVSGADVRDDQVRLSWEPTERDLVGAIAWSSRAQRRQGAAAAGLGGLLLGSGAWILGAPLGLVGVGLALGAALAVALLWVEPSRRARALLRADPRVLEPTALSADRAGVRAGRTLYPWSVIRRTSLGRDHLFLHLSATRAIAIPRRAFGGSGIERRAVHILRAWHRRAKGAGLPPLPPPGPDEVSLRYVLRTEDLVNFAQAVQRRDLRFRPALAAVGLGLVGGTVVLGGALSEGRLDPMSTGFALLFFLVLGLFSVGPLWIPTLWTPWGVRLALWRDPARLPVGDVDLRLGPGGGLTRSARGQLQFRWSEVQGLLTSDTLVALMFSPAGGIIIPRRALDAVPGLLARLHGWVGSAPAATAPASPPLAPRHTPPAHPPDPFAPPEG